MPHKIQKEELEDCDFMGFIDSFVGVDLEDLCIAPFLVYVNHVKVSKTKPNHM